MSGSHSSSRPVSWIGVAVCGVLACAWIALVGRPFWRGIRYAHESGELVPFLLGVCALTVVSVTSWFTYRQISRWKARRRDWWRSRNWECCQHCRYDLTPQPDEGVCPECGAKYRKAECIAFWQSYTGDNPRSKTGAGYADPPPPTPAAEQRQ